MADGYRVVLFHAFDGRNRGDRLLVADSLALLERAGVPRSQCCTVAMHAASFADLGKVEQLPAASGRDQRTLSDLVRLAALDLAALPPAALRVPSRLARLVRDADLVVGVGGGYLRAPRGRHSLNTFAFHLPQLAAAAGASCPALYLPQSVGPFEGPVGALIRRHLPQLTWLGVRDDRSLAELPEHTTAERVPDLAVLALARSLRAGLEPKRGGDRVVVIARDVSRAPSYTTSLLELTRHLDCVFAVHSRAAGQDDSQFYSAIGITDYQESVDALADDRIGVAVSVRLHGALQALLAGIPTIHLSYERKGYGAYADLGIAEWLHDVTSFDPTQIRAQAEALLRDPVPFWEALRSKLGELEEADARLLEVVTKALA
jgi:polysaccharide pyruvyl transferase WcaK-like protein